MDAGNKSVRIFVEGHGREPWLDYLDITRTMGWFTALFPVKLSCDYSNPLESLKIVKETLRRVPLKGISFQGDPNLMETMICFNYVGKFQTLESEDAFFSQITDIELHQMNDPDSQVENLLFTASHVDGELVLDACMDQSIDSAMIKTWLQSWKSIFMNTVLELSSHGSVMGFTSSDFTLLPLKTNLNNLEKGILEILKLDLDQVEDIYPATPMQIGVLSSLIRNGSEYLIQQVWKFNGCVDIGRLKAAWSEVVQHYSILRTSFVSTVDGIFQVILKHDPTVWSEKLAIDANDEQGELTLIVKEEYSNGFLLSDHNYVKFATVPVKSISF
jgi:non-ribosomal peptide synthase protein (TIGR01720 family)